MLHLEPVTSPTSERLRELRDRLRRRAASINDSGARHHYSGIADSDGAANRRSPTVVRAVR